MERYEIISKVGEGNFGCVWKAMNKETGEVVAIKQLKQKYGSWKECLNLREVKSLRKMNHPNIMKLKEVNKEYDTLFCVFEYMEFNLLEVMEKRNYHHFSEPEIRDWCFQLFQGLAYMHKSGYFHRDLKPENLLVAKEVIKIADFGSAREINSLPPYTEYISTRWYRAPELLLYSPLYSSKVDMWAMGAIMAELISLNPLFPGTSEVDQICRICSVIGSPTVDSWADGLKLAIDIKYKFPQFPEAKLSALIPSASNDAISLIAALCSWDPSKRPSALEALQHPFFKSCYDIPLPLYHRPTVFDAPSSSALTTKVVGPQCAKKYPGILSSSVRASHNSHVPSRNVVQQKVEMSNPSQYYFGPFPPKSHGNHPMEFNFLCSIDWPPLPPPSIAIRPRPHPWIDKTRAPVLI